MKRSPRQVPVEGGSQAHRMRASAQRKWSVARGRRRRGHECRRTECARAPVKRIARSEYADRGLVAPSQRVWFRGEEKRLSMPPLSSRALSRQRSKTFTRDRQKPPWHATAHGRRARRGKSGSCQRCTLNPRGGRRAYVAAVRGPIWWSFPRDVFTHPVASA